MESGLLTESVGIVMTKCLIRHSHQAIIQGHGQVDRMVKNFHEERDEQNKRHWLEKEKLREVY